MLCSFHMIPCYYGNNPSVTVTYNIICNFNKFLFVNRDASILHNFFVTLTILFYLCRDGQEVASPYIIFSLFCIFFMYELKMQYNNENILDIKFTVQLYRLHARCLFTGSCTLAHLHFLQKHKIYWWVWLNKNKWHSKIPPNIVRPVLLLC